jgi:hypothetical protein
MTLYKPTLQSVILKSIFYWGISDLLKSNRIIKKQVMYQLKQCVMFHVHP